MNVDNNQEAILIHGFPALRIDDGNRLLFLPYQKAFLKMKHQDFSNRLTVNSLKNDGFFEFPETKTNINMKRIVMTLTKQCNLYCKYCFAKCGPEEKEEMSPETAIKIIRDIIKDNSIERVHFTGGEPTLNLKTLKAIVEFFENARTNPMPVFYITTNGVMPSAIIKWLVSKQFAFSVSWDGFDNDIDNKQRAYFGGAKSEDKTRNTILHIVDAVLPLRVRMTVSKINLPHIFESVKWLVDNGVKFIHMDPIVPDGRGEEFIRNYGISMTEFLDVFFSVLELAEENGIWLLNSALSNLYTPQDYYCTSIKDEICHFNPDGSISYCYRIQSHKDNLSDRFIVGDFKEGRREIDSVKSSRLSSTSVSKFPDCINSAFKHFYSGGCPLRNILASGNFNIVDKDAMKTSEEFYKRAILHVYARALEGKGSSLEGYLQFYKNLVPKEYLPIKTELHNKEITSNYIEQIPIPMTPMPQNVDIDACDICV